ncbi:unnamed protein product, partial [Oikopleura dioica]
SLTMKENYQKLEQRG